MRRLVVAALAACVACGPPPAGMTTAAAPRRSASGALFREDRVLIGRGTEVRVVGVSRRYVYAVTRDAVLVYDRDRRAWQPPYARDGGFDPSAIRAIAVDPDDESAWLVSGAGAFTLQPATSFLMRAPAGALPSRLKQSTLATVYREFPALQGFAPLLTRDANTLQQFPVISGARAPDRTEVWLGTAGGGLFQVDPLFNSATSLPFGLAVTGAGAMARAADGIWIAPAPQAGDGRMALTFASRELQRFKWLDEESRRGFGDDRALALDVRGSTAWMGTTRGLYRIALEGGAARAFTPMAGLPSDVVLSVLARAEGTWVGTSRGLAFLESDSADKRGRAVVDPSLGEVPVRAIVATGDTLWVATDGGLVLRPPGAPSPFVRPREGPFSPRLRQPIRGIARADSLVFVATRDAVLAFNLRTGDWSEPLAAAPWRAVGEIDALAADGRSVWAGGALGVVSVDRRAGTSRIVRMGSDLPDVVTGIVLDGNWGWVSTLAGVVRFRRGGDGLIP